MVKKKIKRLAGALAVGVASSLVAFSVSAADAAGGPDLSALTGAISFGTVTTAVLAVAASLAVVYVAMKGATLALSMLRR